ncbi:Na(+)-translocating NADH-quinone reductase subunit A [Cytophagales bacterium LB-30]|uniref:Na(+)-translocating NADH-quinone reductase subunit A n=1 Tax=Shiella aurantiaca TaxID=3058365 RepID=A0ABT8F9A1_9BACT|nr:Na(+)-translocating NADH-quinone reductase subunit A [Shiella aurantiaca]MDN4166536.1 Na(+)-translocating NADH-quinone reductase subunit A [Shiella aurantiaca]
MSKFIKLKKGFNINLAGKAETKIVDNIHPDTFALKPADFFGIERPKLLVNEGDTVKAGSPLLLDKKREQVLFTAPVSGEITHIVRGEKRKLLEIRIKADKEVKHEEFKKYSTSEIQSLSKDEAAAQLYKSGAWVNLVERPYGVVANPEVTPKSIFISAFDTSPLAADYNFVFKGQEQYFQAGISILKKFTSGTIHLNINADAEVAPIFAHAKEVQVNKFSGPHPAGNVGVQIHHIDPIGKGDTVWTIKPFGVIQIGKLFLEGILDASKVIALAGSEVSQPQYYKTYVGACINKFVEGNVKQDHVRFVSGNPLTGEKIAKDGHVRYFDDVITVLPEGDHYQMFGWILPTANKLSFHKSFGLFSWLNGSKKEYVLDTNMQGEDRAFVQTGVFEQVTPMDILPVHLLKAIMAEDYDNMEALGILEVVEEDLALCEFVDVSKHPVQEILREGITLMQNS